MTESYYLFVDHLNHLDVLSETLYNVARALGVRKMQEFAENAPKGEIVYQPEFDRLDLRGLTEAEVVAYGEDLRAAITELKKEWLRTHS